MADQQAKLYKQTQNDSYPQVAEVKLEGEVLHNINLIRLANKTDLVTPSIEDVIAALTKEFVLKLREKDTRGMIQLERQLGEGALSKSNIFDQK